MAGGRGEGAAASGGSPVTEASEGSKTDKQITQLIASLVDERLTVRKRKTLAENLSSMQSVLFDWRVQNIGG